MVELLLAKGAYVDPASIGGTPLHVAATAGQDGTMKILLEHNADVSISACYFYLEMHFLSLVRSHAPLYFPFGCLMVLRFAM